MSVHKMILLSCFLIVWLVFPAYSSSAASTISDDQIVHLLNRISFGPAPGDIETVRSIGVNAYIEKQLQPNSFQASESLQTRLTALATLHASIADLAATYEPPAGLEKTLSEEQRKEVNQRRNTILQELSEAKILRAVSSPAQLQEVMTDFWFNHFNVFAEKGADRIFIGAYERDAIRPYALGKFSDLVEATAHHPAMLFYLDNWQNTDPNSVAARGKKLGINENYAREVMELHTLGVDGGYTQQDVTTLAHILTGWGLSNGRELAERASFQFDPRRHDFTNMQLLGYSIQGGGEQEIESVLDMLARHPSTANHIAYELAQYFVADDPPPSLVLKLSNAFTATGGDITAVLRVLFHSDEFWDKQYFQNKFKPPFRYVASTLRVSNILPPGDTKQIQGALANMGEPLYRCLTPNGYSNKNDQWLNSDALLKRIDFAKSLAKFLDSRDSVQLIFDAMGRVWSASTLKTVQGADDAKLKPALLLSSPEFVNY